LNFILYYISKIGNVETKEDGSAAFQFLSPFIQLFGIQGIVGRSIVIHEKPSQYPQIYTPVINPPTYPYQAEEDVVGAKIACGIITVTSNA
jgi:superoxide dismutase, Cu-Zn family